jgi:hypothetical protein
MACTADVVPGPWDHAWKTEPVAEQHTSGHHDAGEENAGLDGGDAQGHADAGALVNPLDPADAADAGADANLEAERWTWVPLPGAVCADGTETGIGVNLADESNDVLLFLQGGGACWSGETCWGPLATSMYVQTGYNELAFVTDVMRPAVLPMRRYDLLNPFRHLNMIYVPYCTGDVHAGDTVTTYEFMGQRLETHHRGHRNVGLALEYVVQHFPMVRRLFLAGDSAGGFGAALNLDRVKARLPDVRVDVIDDSGQPIEPAPGRWATWRDAWNIQLPSDCAQCPATVNAVVDYYRFKYPEQRFALISYTHDSIIASFMGLDIFTFNSRLESVAEQMGQQWPNAHYYFIAGTSHVGFATPTLGLIAWLNDMVNDQPAWSSFNPL